MELFPCQLDENTLILVMCWTALHFVGTYLSNYSTVGSTKKWFLL